MFGYVRPVLNQLTAEERETYKSVYCGLCHTMGKRHGWLARFTLNYDFTLLALLHFGCSASSETICRRCPIHPFQKKRRCLCGNPLDIAADESMILTWYKLCDDVADRSFLGGIPVRVLRRLLRSGYRRAAKARPEFDKTVFHEMTMLNALEAERSPQLDRAADTFAKILSGAAADCTQTPSEERIMEQLLYHLGRWIYLVDAWDDLEEDLKNKRYNPLDARFSGKAKNEADYVRTTMTHSVHLVWAAANLLDFGSLRSVIENILHLGLPAVQKTVLEGRGKELLKQGRTIHERSV